MIYEPFVKDTNPPTPGGDQLQLNFLNMYIQSLDPRAQAIMAMGGGIARQNACMALAQTSGLFLDYDIVGQGWDPLFTMSFRQVTCGYGSTPSCLQTQGPTLAGVPIPPGAIKVSLDSEDYPAYVAPGLPQPAIGVRWVGANINGVVYNATAACKEQQSSSNPFPSGEEHSETDADGNLKRYISGFPPNLPGWITWTMQTP